MSTIERTSSVPYYLQLYEALLDRIRQGDLSPGERLPGESELHRDYELSRQTVRQALDLLDSNGFAKKVARRGYFVAEPDKPDGWLIEGLGGFFELGMSHGNPRVSTTVVSAGEEMFEDHVATALRVPRGATGFVLERIRSLDGELALFSTNWSPPAVTPVVAAALDVRDGTSSLTAALQAGGYVAAGAHRVIHAVAAGSRIGGYLQVDAGTPLLRIRSTTWDRSLVPYDYYETYLRTDIVPLAVDASTSDAG